MLQVVGIYPATGWHPGVSLTPAVVQEVVTATRAAARARRLTSSERAAEAAVLRIAAGLGVAGPPGGRAARSTPSARPAGHRDRSQHRGRSAAPGRGRRARRAPCRTGAFRVPDLRVRHPVRADPWPTDIEPRPRADHAALQSGGSAARFSRHAARLLVVHPPVRVLRTARRRRSSPSRFDTTEQRASALAFAPYLGYSTVVPGVVEPRRGARRHRCAHRPKEPSHEARYHDCPCRPLRDRAARPRRRGYRFRRDLDRRDQSRPVSSTHPRGRAHQPHQVRDVDRRRLSTQPAGARADRLGPSSAIEWALHPRTGHASEGPQRAPLRYPLGGARTPATRDDPRDPRHLGLLAERYAAELSG